MKHQRDATPRSPESFVTFRLAQLQKNLNAQATELLMAGVGLTLVEWRLIQLLRIYDNASSTEIASILQMDRGQLSRKIKKMVDRGLLRFETDTKDQRVQHLHLTESAQQLSQKMMPTMAARQDLLLADVSPEDLEAFNRVVEKIEAASKIRKIP